MILARDFIKDPYVFEFLNIPEPISASKNDIEAALIETLQQFCWNWAKDFSFIGRQFRISTETSHFILILYSIITS